MDANSRVGTKYHRLTAIRQVNGRTFEFRCDCGASKIASIYDVARGATKSCGCLRAEKSIKQGLSMKGKNVKDLAGKRFGMLTVMSLGPSNAHQCATWLCRCDCGGEKIVSANHLTTGNTASCGCAYRARKAVRPEDKRAASNAYVKARYRSDVRYAVNRRALHLIHSSLKVRGALKSAAWQDLVGYPLDALVERLRATMPVGFTWQDFLDGKLHVDHIIPLAAFNFQTETDLDFRRAWALDNLQLLPGAENIAKGDRLFAPFQPGLSF